MLGATKGVSKQILEYELFLVTNIAYVLLVSAIEINAQTGNKLAFLQVMSDNLTLVNYIIFYFVVVTLSFFLSNRFARKLFKLNAITALHEEV